MRSRFAILLCFFAFGTALYANTYRKLITFDCPESDSKINLSQTAPAPEGPWTFEDTVQAQHVQAVCKLAPLPTSHFDSEWNTVDPITEEAVQTPVRVRHSARKPTPTAAPDPISVPITPAVINSSSDSGAASFGLGLILGILFLYFLPIVVSGVRGCKAHNGIVVVNLFLGWTFVGWVVALAWAASGERSPKPLPACPAA